MTEIDVEPVEHIYAHACPRCLSALQAIVKTNASKRLADHKELVVLRRRVKEQRTALARLERSERNMRRRVESAERLADSTYGHGNWTYS